MPTVVNSPTPPSSPADGDLWFNTETGKEYVWYISPSSGGVWVQTQPSGSAVPIAHPVTAPPPSVPSVSPFDVERVPTITISSVAPSVPLVGDLWWSPTTGQQSVWYDDGNTVQWVISNWGAGKPGQRGQQGEQGPSGTTGLLPGTYGDARHVAAVEVNALAQISGLTPVEIDAPTLADFNDLVDTVDNIPPPTWDNITGKPATFPPSAHQHPWGDLTGVPATFPPSAHSHPQSEVTNLVSDLALKAPLASPTFTGDPKAPTPATSDNDTSIATTAYVKANIAAIPAADWGTITNKPSTFPPSAHSHPQSEVTNLVSDLALKAPLASPTFTGDPKAPTPATSDNDTSVATTAYVKANIAAIPAADWGTITNKPATFPPTLPIAQSGITNLTTDLAGKLPVNNPTYTGTLSTNVADPATNDTVDFKRNGSSVFKVDRFGTLITGGGLYNGDVVQSWGSHKAKVNDAPPAGGTLDWGMFFSNVANFGIAYGTGAPDKAFAKGSVYLRRDGTGAPYYNADGTAGGWVQIGAGGSSVFIGTTAPTVPAPVAGNQWWHSDLGQMFIYYDDGNTSQWVPASPAVGAAAIGAGDVLVYMAGDTPINATANVSLCNTGAIGAAGQKWEIEGVALIGSNQTIVTIAGVNIFDGTTQLAGGGGVMGWPQIGWGVTSICKAHKVLTGPTTFTLRGSGNAAGCIAFANGQGGFGATFISARRLY